MMEKIEEKTWKKEAVSCDTCVNCLYHLKDSPSEVVPSDFCTSSSLQRFSKIRVVSTSRFSTSAATELDIPIMTGMDHPF